MTTPAIKVEGLSKQYTVGAAQQHATFYDLLTHAIKLPFKGRRDGGESTRPTNQFWALRDINFEVQPGDVLGIIGRNGAGKSTLLKILSRITEPTEGKVTIRGQVSSLLEVGTGFHPELTGRENVFLNGAILGMTRREIQARFDEIVDFAEMEKFIDTPVKRYSSGMTVRLAFAVAAHLEPDILIADEVLAVGDMAFQRKSLGKMEDAARRGRTVLFVSHNLGAVRNLCRSVLLLENGQIKYQGGVEEGVSSYERGLTDTKSSLASSHFQGPLSDRIQFMELIFRQRGLVVTIIDPLQELEIELRGATFKTFQALDVNIRIYRDGFHLADCHDATLGTGIREGAFVSMFQIPDGTLKPGRYTIGIGAVAGSNDWTWGPDMAVLDVTENWGDDSGARDKGAVNFKYSAERIQ